MAMKNIPTTKGITIDNENSGMAGVDVVV